MFVVSLPFFSISMLQRSVLTSSLVPTTPVLAVLGLVLLPIVSTAQSCPQDLRGAWTTDLPVRQLFEVQFVVREKGEGAYEVDIRSAQTTETVPAWRDGERIRFQPTGLPIAFDGNLTPDGDRIVGFIQQASMVTRVELPLVSGSDSGSEPRSWSLDWNLIGVSDESLRLDLYIEDEGSGNFGGYWFFRDQRLPGLYGLGVTCTGSDAGSSTLIRAAEKNLALDFEGRFDSDQDILNLTVTGFGGSFSLSFSRIPDNEVPSRADEPELPARTEVGEGETYARSAPQSINDGWAISHPSQEGLNPETIGDMVGAIAAEELPLTHSVLVARNGKLAVEEYFYGFDRMTWHEV